MVIPILRSRMLMRGYPTWRPCNCQSALLSRELFLLHRDERFVVSSSNHKPVINAIKWNENDWPTVVPQELGTQLKAIMSPAPSNRDIQVLIRFENIAQENEGAMARLCGRLRNFTNCLTYLGKDFRCRTSLC